MDATAVGDATSNIGAYLLLALKVSHRNVLEQLRKIKFLRVEFNMLEGVTK